MVEIIIALAALLVTVIVIALIRERYWRNEDTLKTGVVLDLRQDLKKMRENWAQLNELRQLVIDRDLLPIDDLKKYL